MKRSAELREQKALILEQMNRLHEQAEKEGRTFNEAEREKFNELEARGNEMNDRIEQALKREERDLELIQTKAVSISPREAREIRKYSIVEAIRAASGRGEFNGLVKEMHEEAEKEARDAGISISGVGIPGFLMHEKRAIHQVDDGGSNTVGAKLKPTDMGSLIDLLKPDLVAQQLGATMLTGLKGDLALPKALTGMTAVWETEVADANDTNATFGEVKLAPNRLAAYTDVSKLLLNQSSIDIEGWVRQEISRAVSVALETALITGTGSPITGIIATSGVGDVNFGAAGGAPTHALLAAMEAEVAIDNALMGSLGWMTNHKVRSKLRTVSKDAGSGQFIWEPGDTILGYKTGITSLVPSDLSKSTGSNLSAIIFGNWNDLLIGNWGGYDLTVDPYTQGIKAVVRLVINSFWDIKLRNAQSFAFTNEVITT